ncbi:hypothetical protein BC828DRAFT_382434 [Blastocladiella britannica]|nr:hypothetical protein BC828DRAFT_382434 [Blastocladiella britannica]
MPPIRPKKQTVVVPLTAALSGVLAALAAAATKLAVLPQVAAFLGQENDLVARAISGAAVAVANVLMWLTFSRALAMAASTVQVTTVNTLTNMLTTALLGTVIFGEPARPPVFWVGLLLVGLGSLLLNRQQPPPPHDQPEKPKAE